MSSKVRVKRKVKLGDRRGVLFIIILALRRLKLEECPKFSRQA